MNPVETRQFFASFLKITEGTTMACQGQSVEGKVLVPACMHACVYSWAEEVVRLHAQVLGMGGVGSYHIMCMHNMRGSRGMPLVKFCLLVLCVHNLRVKYSFSVGTFEKITYKLYL